MMIRVGALAFRVAMQRLGQRRLRETWYKLRRWLASCRAADLRKLTLLLRMTYLIESYHDKISKKGKIQKRKQKRASRNGSSCLIFISPSFKHVSLSLLRISTV